MPNSTSPILESMLSINSARLNYSRKQIHLHSNSQYINGLQFSDSHLFCFSISDNIHKYIKYINHFLAKHMLSRKFLAKLKYSKSNIIPIICRNRINLTT